MYNLRVISASSVEGHLAYVKGIIRTVIVYAKSLSKVRKIGNSSKCDKKISHSVQDSVLKITLSSLLYIFSILP